jgi:group I intron endonuclease
VLEHGWSNFKFGILEYLDISDLAYDDTNGIKKLSLEREQYFFNIINPTLNICKTAGSPLGIKHGISFSKNLSDARRGRKNKPNKIKINIRPKVISSETRLKLSYRSSGIKVKLFDTYGNMINQFPTMSKAAEYLGVSDRTVRRVLNTGISYDNFIYKFEVVSEHPIVVEDKEYNVIKKYSSVRALAKDMAVSRYTISVNINSNKLLKGRYILSRC